MIVIDTSAMVEFLVGDDERAERVRGAAESEGSLATPHGIDLECASSLRGLVRGGKLAQGKADYALEVLQQLAITRYEHTWYLARIWELRANMWPYDAAYVALAEALAVPLLTVDCKFERTPGAHCEIVTVKAASPQPGK
ncbi:type II toxin-antitoxin system VapC family toxin [Glycomyces albidus]|uniref:Ribonuclease VapC n=1 Tax=Glycomyces albidus TaxID=2656774 RepID=A0A6L5G9Q8_9ACTN|nr:type II toxin-antitoxin system VapC family toxin [Glycomyces albidus]MQM26422.1 PIN domain-containing protein [Glycomyces albidus]